MCVQKIDVAQWSILAAYWQTSAGLGRTRADHAISRRKGQTFRADSIVMCDAKFSFEHLAHPLAERELINLRFDRRFLATQQASHEPTLSDLR